MKVRRVFALVIVVGALALPVGFGTVPASAAPPSLPSFTKVTTALRHSCAVGSDGSVWCWGTNSPYQLLGDPTVPEGALRSYPARVSVAGSALEGKLVADLDAGTDATCAVTTVGGVACWGRSLIGDGLQNGTATPKSPDFSQSALQGKPIAQVEVSASAACAISTDGGMTCWGKRPGTSFTDRQPNDIDAAGTVLQGKAIRAVDTTRAHTCAVTTDGILACWGFSEDHRLGPSNTADKLKPIAVDLTGSSLAGKAIVDVTTDDDRSCALASDGSISCWGTSLTGFLDLPTAGTTLAGKTIVDLLHKDGLTCARTSTGTFACLGDNESGRAGASGGDTTTWKAIESTGTPMQGKQVTDLTVGEQTTCAVTTGGIAACWGANASFEGGNSTHHDYRAASAGYGPPTPPTQPVVTPGPRSLNVSWLAPTSTGGYPITSYRVTVGSPFFTAWKDVPAGTTKATVDGLINGQSYSVSITASNELGTSLKSGTAKGTPEARPTTVAPFVDWTAFTTQQFADLENRQPTSAELGTWTSTLAGDATKKGTLVEGIRRGTDNTTAVDPAVRLYRAFLGRIPDAGGLRFWVSRRRTGAWNLTRIADSFATSTEFKRKYGALTNEQFVTRIYTDVLGRDADPTGVDYWTRQLDLKRRTRGSVMVGFSESSEYKTKQADGTDVVVAYVYLLGRAPTTAEEANWIALRKVSNSHALLVRELLDSQEYADRIT